MRKLRKEPKIEFDLLERILTRTTLTITRVLMWITKVVGILIIIGFLAFLVILGCALLAM